MDEIHPMSRFGGRAIGRAKPIHHGAHIKRVTGKR
jgi:hypothetical protein